MLLITETHVPAVPLVLFNGANPAKDQCPNELVPLPVEMLEIFAQITGWVVEFAESKSSHQKRQLPSMICQPATGNFSIVDMSANWPAGKPTAHRAKCDQFVGYLDGLVRELQQTKSQLVKAQSQLAAYSPGSVEDEDAILVDSFISRYPNDEENWDNDFEVVDEFVNDKSVRAVNPPFEGWRLGGAPGISNGRYVDWKLSDDERINLIVGQIETQGEDVEGEAVLTVDPLTNEYFLSGDEEFKFLIFDQKNGSLTCVEQAASFRQLDSSQFVIMSTSGYLMQSISSNNQKLIGEPDQIAKQISELLGGDEQVLVLKRG